jgi:outer membrane protein TolC
MKHIIFPITFLIIVTNVFAQDAWTLEHCINYAFNNNLTIKQYELNSRYQQNQLQQSKNNRLPNLSAGISQGVRLIIAMQKQGRQLLNRTFYKPNTNLYSVLKSLIFIMEFQFHYSLGDVLCKKNQ